MAWQDNLRRVAPYVAGEQPKMKQAIKLNTNENPYGPTPAVKDVFNNFDAERLRLYPMADADDLRAELARYYGLSTEQVYLGNGSDEVLALSFLTFFNSQQPILVPDISYSFYPVYSDLYQIPTKRIPLRDDFTININDYQQANGGIVIANPNAPTGLLLGLDGLEKILKQNRNSVVLIDEAYIDFAPDNSSAIKLINEYDNLVVTQTFSKSRALAGIRLGVALGSPAAITALYDVKNSFNSYPLDTLTQEVGLASLKDEAYFRTQVARVVDTRETFSNGLQQLGFKVLTSATNFVFASYPGLTGEKIYQALYQQQIIVRYWNAPRIKDWVRISIGTNEQMERVLAELKKVVEGRVDE